METPCQVKPKDKKGYIRSLGKVLVEDYGKKKYYKPEEVKKAHKRSDYTYLDFSCWGMSVFSSHAEFDEYHAASGEACDYVGMKTEMLQGLSTSSDTNWTELPEFMIEASWLDAGEIFGGILEGIGEFFVGIFN